MWKDFEQLGGYLFERLQFEKVKLKFAWTDELTANLGLFKWISAVLKQLQFKNNS